MSIPTYPAYFTKAGQPSFSTAAAVSDYVPEFPFGESRPEAVVITQRFWQLRADYARPAPNALNCPAYPTARFCDDRDFRDVGMGITEFTREWATVPGPREEYESYAFRFPGFDVLLTQRDPFTRSVPARVAFQYFLTGPGGSFASPDLIALAAPFVFEGDYLTDESDPSFADYQAIRLVAYALVLDVTLTRWRGNIWERATRAITAL